MSNTDFTAEISERSPRAKEWREMGFTSEVILKHPIPQRGRFPNVGVKEYYELDLEAITPEQRSKLIKHTAKKFGLPESEVEKDLDKVGMPILAEDVWITIKNPQKWLD